MRDVVLPGWDDSSAAFDTIVLAELWRSHHALLDDPGVGDFVNTGIRVGRGVTDERLASAMSARARWRAEIGAVLRAVDVLALPTLVADPPPLSGSGWFPLTRLTAPVNLAGVPALSMPVPSPGFAVPVSLQLVGPGRGEDLLCATGLAIEAALAGHR